MVNNKMIYYIEKEIIHKNNYKKIYNLVQRIFYKNMDKNLTKEIIELLNYTYDNQVNCENTINIQEKIS